VNILRRLPLYRLLLLCGLVIAVGVSATALAFALDSGPKPPPKPLAEAVHDALSATPVEGVSADIQFTNHLFEGAELASGGGAAGELAQSPLISGASGRLWIGKEGRVRIELQAEKGDTEILSDGHTLSLYDAATNTLYRYTPTAGEEQRAQAKAGAESLGRAAVASQAEVQPAGANEIDVAIPDAPAHHHESPTVAKIEEAISHLRRHATVSDATPSDVAAQPAYTVRVSPGEGGSLLGGAEVSFDAVHGFPLRAAIYSSQSSSPVIELAATDVSYGPVANSVFAFSPPPGVKIKEIKFSHADAADEKNRASGSEKPTVTTHGHGVTAIAVIESKSRPGDGKSASEPLEGLPKVTINGTSATELRTELGTLLSFERSGVRYVLAGSVTPTAIEALARGL
jgi:outer membrane lipoprotein-sorting protein